jgi:hypothetical protein
MKFWLDDPTVLLNSKYITELWPYSSMSVNEKLNAMTRFVIVATLLGYMCLNRYIVLILGLIIIGVIVFMYRIQPEKENMSNYYEINKQQTIDSNNPMGNVLMTDYKYNPYKSATGTEYNPLVESTINNSVKDFVLQENKDNKDMAGQFSYLGDQLVFEQSMHSFYTNPVTTVPNSQDDFLKFCYGELPSDKPLQIY